MYLAYKPATNKAVVPAGKTKPKSLQVISMPTMTLVVDWRPVVGGSESGT